MAAISTGNHPKALWPGIHAWWGRRYNEFTPCWPEMFDTRSSNKSYEETVEVTGFALAPVKSEGTGISYDTEVQGETYRYTNTAYALGYIVTHEELMDNLYAEVSRRRAGALAFSMRQTKETVGAQVYNRGFNSSFTFGDGKEMLATDHPTSSGDQQNELTTAADISETAVEDLCILIRKVKNDRGLRLNLTAQKMILPPDLEYEATRILRSTLQNDTANNAVNALRSLGKFSQGIKVNPFLTDADAWFVRTDCPDSMIMFNRESISFSQDNDFDTKNAKAACYERYVFGMSDWRGIWGSPGA